MVEQIVRAGFAFVHASEMRPLLTAAGSLADWPAFAASWNDLELDHYLADGGRYRQRRHAVYAASVGGAIVRVAHQPHYQSRDYNALNGGIARVHQLDGAELGVFTLTAPLDAALLDDGRVAHGVTPIGPVDPSRPAHRDVLVVTWRRQPADAIESP